MTFPFSFPFQSSSSTASANSKRNHHPELLLLHQRKFRETKSFNQRCDLSRDLLAQFPRSIPVIVERGTDEFRLPIIDKKQYLVPQDMTFSKFFFVIRHRLGLNDKSSGLSNLGVWIYSGKHPITSPSATMSEIYSHYRDNDGFLYLQYRGENVFG